ncbi:uncharacterized protein SAMN04489867_0371 [Pedococcus dokdonensis]|uniref:Metal-binding protein n=1 Tax=Pedococcus dokdonensis TaxID=443156 RepID=A0A1H0LRI5_9MICO|nr:YceD family protein [Pedococcus dokdonensis]SDO70616.1 uncharacterized protein SAMN04489867_0371 [Pedococcus dokdonensis]
MEHLNPRSPLVFDTTDLGRRPGSMERLQRTVEAPAVLGTDVIAVPVGSPVELELRLESVVEGVLVTGSVHATATGACVRCLDPVSREVDGRFQELFAYADRAAHHRAVGADDDETDEHVLEGDLFDLEPVLVDTVVPALPFQPVCRDDCPGLCSECGARLADDPDHHHEVLDPRWAALSALSAEGNPGSGATHLGTTQSKTPSNTPSNTEEKRN